MEAAAEVSSPLQGQQMDPNEPNIDELLSKSTVKEDLPLTITGNFQSEEHAQELFYTVLGFARIFGSVFDLTALDGITVADDYVAALAAIDRGYPNMKAATPTSDEFGAGFAMAVPVLRNGQHKSHVVLDSALVRPLVDPANAYYGLAVHTLCHELAHVYDHLLRSKAMPNHYGTPMPDLREAVLTQFAMAAWDEYTASRLSANWGTPDYCSRYEQTLVPMLGSLLARSEAAKHAFAQDKNVERTMNELRGVFETFFVRGSYLIGHIDGLGKTLEEEAPTLAAALCETSWLNALWSRYLSVLRSMFEKIDSWEGVQEYQRLKDLGEELLSRGGMGFVKLPTGGYFVGFNPTRTL
jgi:hypothetical protein